MECVELIEQMLLEENFEEVFSLFMILMFCNFFGFI
jgi:hypothetical protein